MPMASLKMPNSLIDVPETRAFFTVWIPIFEDLCKTTSLNERKDFKVLHEWIDNLWEEKFLKEQNDWLDEHPQCLETKDFWKKKFHKQFMNIVHNNNRRVEDVKVINDDDKDSNENTTNSNPVTPNSLNISRTPIKNKSNESKIVLSQKSIVVDCKFTGKAKEQIVQAILRYKVLKQKNRLSANDEPLYLNNQWLDFSVEANQWLRSGKRCAISMLAWKQLFLDQFKESTQLKTGNAITSISESNNMQKENMTNANTSRSTAQHDTTNSTASADENDDKQKENPADANRLRPTTRSMTASTQRDVFGNVKPISPPHQKKESRGKTGDFTAEVIIETLTPEDDTDEENSVSSYEPTELDQNDQYEYYGDDDGDDNGDDVGPRNIAADNKVNDVDEVEDDDNLDPGSVNADLPKPPTPETFSKSNAGESIEVARSNEETSNDVDERNACMNVVGEVPFNGFEQYFKIWSHIVEILDKIIRSGKTPAEAITEATGEEMDDIEQSDTEQFNNMEPVANTCDETVNLKRIRGEDEEGEMRSRKHRRVFNNAISTITLTKNDFRNELLTSLSKPLLSHVRFGEQVSMDLFVVIRKEDGTVCSDYVSLHLEDIEVDFREYLIKKNMYTTIKDLHASYCESWEESGNDSVAEE